MSKKEEEKPARNDGSYAIDLENKKINVSLSNGEHSILFEDIASTSYQTHFSEKITTPDQSFKTWGVIAVSIIVPIIMLGSQVNGWICLGAMVLGLYFSGWKGGEYEKISWDDVTIETKGGKQITYSVNGDQGKVDIDAIETARRG